MLFLDSFLEALLTFPPYQYALLAGICIGIIAPLIGSVVVIRRLSFIADTLSHFSLAGVTFGVFISKLIPSSLLGIDPIFLGVVFSIVGTFIIEKLRGFYKNYKELSMPIVMSFGVALSGLFIAITPGISTSFTTGLLFGSIVSVGLQNIIVILIVSFVIILFIAFFYKQIVSLCFDEVYARISGINVKLLQTIITIILAVVISVFIDFVGVLLINALLIVPVAAAILVGNSFKGTVLKAIIFSEISILLGFYISFVLNLPIGATVVLINVIILLVIMIIIKVKKIFKNKFLEGHREKEA